MFYAGKKFIFNLLQLALLDIFPKTTYRHGDNYEQGLEWSDIG